VVNSQKLRRLLQGRDHAGTYLREPAGGEANQDPGHELVKHHLPFERRLAALALRNVARNKRYGYDGAAGIAKRRDRQRHLYRRPILSEPLRLMSLDSLAGKAALPNGLRFAVQVGRDKKSHFLTRTWAAE